MTTSVAQLTTTGETAQTSENQRAYRSKIRQRRLVVRLTQFTVLLVLLGGWQLFGSRQGAPRRSRGLR